ncbi:hypothetical protein FACS1894159_05310 [Bacteroidia bacterium]|nr:hypothetical protein FACS1894159_05310 [Bacteroidia bacterium]
MKQISTLVGALGQEDIARIEADGGMNATIDGVQIAMTLDDLEITSEDMPGWLVTGEGRLTVALDITVTDELRREGCAREIVNRIQNLRKDSGLEVTDKIRVAVQSNDGTAGAVAGFGAYIAAQTLAVEVVVGQQPEGEFVAQIEIDEQPLWLAITKV